ncbi:MAG: tetratricopeptide repeat protein [Planctomycetes bacterium]|nr:tetratricopeptide repeat protein [Planctomycetota bacterium]
MTPSKLVSRTARGPLAALVLVVLALACHANTLENGFVLDDSVVLLNDPTVRDLRNVPQYFSTYYWSTSLAVRRQSLFQAYSYRPLAMASFALDYALWGGLNARGFHLTNVLLHAAIVLVLLLLLRGLLGDATLAWLTAALFAVHPVHTEAVAAICFRTELLSTLFGLASMLVYAPFLPHDLLTTAGPAAQAPTRWSVRSMGRLFFAALLLLLGLFSKETAIVAPALLTALEAAALVRTPRSEGAAGRKELTARLLRALVRLGGLALGFGLYLRFRMSALHHLGSGLDLLGFYGASPLQAMATLVAIFGDYVRLSFWPYPLCADYPENANRTAVFRSLTEPAVLLSLAVVASSLVGTATLARRRPDLAFFGFWFYVALFPISNVVFPLIVLKTERSLYLPSVGPCAILGALVLGLDRGLKTPARRLLALTLAIAGLAGGSFLTVTRNRDWRDGISLARSVVACQPDNSRGYLWLGSAYMEAHRPAEAIPPFDRMLRLVPDNWWGLLHRGLARQAAGDPEGALDDFNASLAARPSSPVRVHRARSLLALGREEEAWEDLRQDRRDFPDDPETAREYGLACLRRGRLQEGRQAVLQTLAIRGGAEPPPAIAERELGRALLDAGRPAEALERLDSAAQSLRAEPRLEVARGEALLALGRAEAARAAFEAALGSSPEDPAALLGQARCRLATGKEPEAALAVLLAALPRASNPAPLRQSLVVAYLRTGRAREADEELERMKAAGLPPSAEVVRELRRRP